MASNSNAVLPISIPDISTPALILDKQKVNANIQRFKSLADRHGVKLRTHMKTCKSADIANLLLDDNHNGITVSTLKEAEYFTAAGCRDILYAVSLNPRRFPQLKWFYQQGVKLRVILDDINVARDLAQWAAQEKCLVNCLIEIDVDGHRAGIKPEHDDLIPIARLLDSASHVEFAGVMTHGGGSYNCASFTEIQAHAAQERDRCVAAAQRIRDAGIAVPIVSIGSTPTVAAADHFAGVTEIRPGVYVFFDLFQHGLTVCHLPDIALSVLTTVIGHHREQGRIFLDAGGLALSKDHSTASQQNDYGFGLVCTELGEPLVMPHSDKQSHEGIATPVTVETVYQEHGVIAVSDPALYTELPIGTLLRIIPNHACMTAAAHEAYFVVERDAVTAVWQRCNGW